MNGTLQVEVRNVYGAWKIYPFNDTAQAFARIAGTTTLTGPTLREADRLGYFIEAVNGLLIDNGAILAQAMGKAA